MNLEEIKKIRKMKNEYVRLAEESKMHEDNASLLQPIGCLGIVISLGSFPEEQYYLAFSLLYLFMVYIKQ